MTLVWRKISLDVKGLSGCIPNQCHLRMERCKKREIRKRAWEAENQRGEAVCGKDPRTSLMSPWGFVVWVLPFYHLLRSARMEA